MSELLECANRDMNNEDQNRQKAKKERACVIQIRLSYRYPPPFARKSSEYQLALP